MVLPQVDLTAARLAAERLRQSLASAPIAVGEDARGAGHRLLRCSRPRRADRPGYGRPPRLPRRPAPLRGQGRRAQLHPPLTATGHETSPSGTPVEELVRMSPRRDGEPRHPLRASAILEEAAGAAGAGAGARRSRRLRERPGGRGAARRSGGSSSPWSPSRSRTSTARRSSSRRSAARGARRLSCGRGRRSAGCASGPPPARGARSRRRWHCCWPKSRASPAGTGPSLPPTSTRRRWPARAPASTASARWPRFRPSCSARWFTPRGKLFELAPGSARADHLPAAQPGPAARTSCRRPRSTSSCCATSSSTSGARCSGRWWRKPRGSWPPTARSSWAPPRPSGRARGGSFRWRLRVFLVPLWHRHGSGGTQARLGARRAARLRFRGDVSSRLSNDLLRASGL